MRSVTYLHGLRAGSDLERVTNPKPARLRILRSLERRWAKRKAAPRFDIVHGPNYALPDFDGAGIVTFHDLSVFRYPELHPPARVAHFEKDVRRALDRAAHLIADCEAIKQELIGFAGLDSSKVTAVPLGLSERFRPSSAEERSAILRRYGLPETGYGLTVSSLEPRKRIDRLLAAWRILPTAVRSRYPLVVAGAKGWHNERLLEDIDRAVSEGWAISLGFVPDEALPGLLSGASLFVFPSVYEGFGLPPLEAMACGVPTLVAREPCLEEVTAGAAMLCDPEDISGFAAAIVQGLEDEPWREGAISGGIQVAGGYTWQRCVDETVGVYQRVIAAR